MLSNPLKHTQLRKSVSEEVCLLSVLESDYCKMYICIIINMHIVAYNLHIILSIHIIILFGILLVFIANHTSNNKNRFRLSILTCTCFIYTKLFQELFSKCTSKVGHQTSNDNLPPKRNGGIVWCLK